MRVIAVATLLLSAWAGAAALQVSITPFQRPTGLLEDRNFRYLQTEALVPPAENVATHLVLDGLLPVSASAPTVVAGPYRAINLADGAEQDRGQVMLDLPDSGELAGAVSSPILGIVPRSGAWESYAPTPVTTWLGGAAGTSSYDPLEGIIQLTLARPASLETQVFEGTAEYYLEGVNRLVLAPFTLSSGGESHAFARTVLYRLGDTYAGELPAMAGPDGPSPDSSLYFLTVVDPNDTDGDWIPDLSDPPGGSLAWHDQAEPQEDGSYPSWVGSYYLLGGNDDRTWIYHVRHGYWYVFGAGPRSAYFYDYQLGWLWTSAAIHPFLFRFSESTWHYFFTDSGGPGQWRYFAAYRGGAWETIAVGFSQ